MPEYIDREALISDIQAAVDNSGMGVMIANALKRYVKRVPCADVAQVRHGRWFDTGVENKTGNIYFCSVCNKYHNPNKKDVQMKRAKEKPAYCPNCGAKMDGGASDGTEHV